MGAVRIARGAGFRHTGRMPSYRSPFFLSITLAALALSGCGKKNGELFEEVRPQYEPLRLQVQKIAAELPDGQATQLAGKLGGKRDAPNPKPVLRDDGHGNLVFLHVRQLSDVDVRIDELSDLNLYLGGDFRTLLGWIAKPTTLSAATLESRSGQKFLDMLAKPRAQVRYLGVYRPVKYERPIAQDEKSFTGGRAVVEFFVYDLADGKLLAQWTQTTRPDETVSYLYKPGEDKKERLESWARSSIYTNMLKALGEALPREIGGEFVK